MVSEEDNMVGEEGNRGGAVRGCSFYKERVYLLTKKGGGAFAGIKARLFGA